ncbi:MAG: bifunctional phosphopantothenoylcysteine decarboxylase/phosphopantothenate--cysteine ligase CoaBC [Rhodobacteraceae bacterium]|nr:bifunctional phosphopantothenoylcysteine decarboxylase/phosphopantothenate--cysteine ligase CoaBC [Paracoccaceae bacterium]
MMNNSKRILLIIGGGVAAYKALEVIRGLSDKCYEVRCVLTKAGEQFVTPLSVSSLSGNQVSLDLFSHESEAQFSHIELARWADTILVAPATADFMAKVANGHADDLATAMILATTSQVVFAPAMNVKMWENVATQANIKRIAELGYSFIGPTEGKMACGEYGLGRMAEPEQIISELEMVQTSWTKRGKGLTAIITSGPTREAIDPVRYISNHSSGKQGTEIAKELREQGFKVKMVSGPSLTTPPTGIDVIKVVTAQEMLEAVSGSLPCDVFISVAAVSDWRVKEYSPAKIKKSNQQQTLTLKFIKNPDILATVAHHKTHRPKLVVGFAAETSDLEKNAKLKLDRKNCDWIVANNVSEEAGFMGSDSNEVQIHTHANTYTYPCMKKSDVAVTLTNHILESFNR